MGLRSQPRGKCGHDHLGSRCPIANRCMGPYCVVMAPPSLVMAFGPRDQGELDVVLGLIDVSYKFARGL